MGKIFDKLDAAALEDLRTLYKKGAELEPGSGFEPLPAGIYDVEISKITSGLTRDTKKLMISWDLIVSSGESHSGRHTWKNYVLDTPEKMRNLLDDIAKFGVPITADVDLEEYLSALVGETCKIQVVLQKDGKSLWTNILDPHKE